MKPRVSAFLARLRRAVDDGRVRYTDKARDELIDAGRDLLWANRVLVLLAAQDLERIEASAHDPAERVWTFCPDVDGAVWWIRIVERSRTVVISFHDAGEV